MTDKLKIAFAQANPTVGALDANLAMAMDYVKRCEGKNIDLLVFPELFICGYPPEDLILKAAFVEAAMARVRDLATSSADSGLGIIIGTPWEEAGKVYNAVALLHKGKVETLRFKHDLPNYGVFDEKRVFAAGRVPGPISFKGVRLGVPICEDIWKADVCESLAETGAEIILVPNGSPFHQDKRDTRLNIVVERIAENHLPIAYVNQVGGQDELVFDGASFCINADQSLAFEAPSFSEQLIVSNWQRKCDGWYCEKGEISPTIDKLDAIWRACVVGLRDYVEKNRFPGVVLGLSGGIDSAVVAAMAVDALGKDRVHCVMLPYRYTSEESLKDAKACIDALKCRYDIVPIGDPVEKFNQVLAEMFAGTEQGVTEENIQSRARGVILMAISNKFNHMVVTTGNKSEMSVGYATLYGDMNGGFNPIKDVYKVQVYDLARFRNQNRPDGCLGPEGEVVPDNIITKAPSAELRPDQTDQDSLPPYEILDDILEQLVEKEAAIEDIIARGHDPKTVQRIQHLLYIAEYKRRQAAPGVKITSRNFGRDRRYPITNGFRDRTDDV